MRKAIERIRDPNPARIADILVHVVRNVSVRVPSLVGKSAMVTCIPRPNLSNPSPFTLTGRRGRPSSDHPTFFYRGEDRDSTLGYAPLFVCGESGSDFHVEYLNETGSDASITLSLRQPRT
jgi:hypothetical protein